MKVRGKSSWRYGFGTSRSWLSHGTDAAEDPSPATELSSSQTLAAVADPEMPFAEQVASVAPAEVYFAVPEPEQIPAERIEAERSEAKRTELRQTESPFGSIQSEVPDTESGVAQTESRTQASAHSVVGIAPSSAHSTQHEPSRSAASIASDDPFVNTEFQRPPTGIQLHEAEMRRSEPDLPKPPPYSDEENALIAEPLFAVSSAAAIGDFGLRTDPMSNHLRVITHVEAPKQSPTEIAVSHPIPHEARLPLRERFRSQIGESAIDSSESPSATSWSRRSSAAGGPGGEGGSFKGAVRTVEPMLHPTAPPLAEPASMPHSVIHFSSVEELPNRSGLTTTGPAANENPAALEASQRITRASSQPVSDKRTGVSRALGAIKLALPLVQRLLPLLDGNVARTVANLLLLPPVGGSSQPAADLGPVERNLNELNHHHRELIEQVHLQNSCLRSVEERLAHVQTATDRNTLEQQELIDDLRRMGKRINAFAMVVLVLLAVSVLANVVQLFSGHRAL